MLVPPSGLEREKEARRFILPYLQPGSDEVRIPYAALIDLTAEQIGALNGALTSPRLFAAGFRAVQTHDDVWAGEFVIRGIR